MVRYPATLDPDPKTGGYVVTFPDVPEGVTQGDNDEEAMDMARDCIITVFAEYIRSGREIPRPSRLRGKRQRMVALPLLVSMKIELYNAWLQSGMRKAELARHLGIPKTVVDRLFNLKHRSRMEQIEAAFEALGKHLEIAVRDAA